MLGFTPADFGLKSKKFVAVFFVLFFLNRGAEIEFTFSQYNSVDTVSSSAQESNKVTVGFFFLK